MREGENSPLEDRVVRVFYGPQGKRTQCVGGETVTRESGPTGVRTRELESV